MLNLRPHKGAYSGQHCSAPRLTPPPLNAGVVQVLGICVHPDGERIYLVMEVMASSLDKMIFNPAQRKQVLTPASKMRDISLQVAAGTN